jgi:hypothetical protein
MCEKTLEEISIKKQSEIELLSKEISSLTVKEKDAKQRSYVLEKELIEVKD